MSKKRISQPVILDETAMRMQEALERKRAALRAQQTPRPQIQRTITDDRQGGGGVRKH